MPQVTFNNRNAAFHAALKRNVEQYFKAKAMKSTGNWKLYLKSGVLIPSAVMIYISLLFFNVAALPAIFLSSVLGLILASIGFNVMHDACHGSYSSHGWINNMMSLSLNALGGNAFIWKFKHNVIHHTYTNVDGVDDDIAKSPLMRQCSTQKWVPAHRFQHVYVVLIYAISSFAWVVLMDFNKYFKGKVFRTALQKMSGREHAIFWMSKVFYVLFYVLIPVFFVGWKSWAIGFTCMHLTMGLTLDLVFQLAHVVEHAGFEHVDEGDTIKIQEEWAVYQVKTTANFAPKNKIVSWFVGGLNYQVEHHLFPRVSHVHYPAISKIVKQICADFNISYNEFPTMRQAIFSHFKMMKQLGARPALLQPSVSI